MKRKSESLTAFRNKEIFFKILQSFQKKDLLTSLLLELLFLAIVFKLPIMKAMTLSELSNRPNELMNPEVLLSQPEFK